MKVLGLILMTVSLGTIMAQDQIQTSASSQVDPTIVVKKRQYELDYTDYCKPV